ncbi:MAG: HIT family protein [Pseudomonadota bacterium]
MSYDENNIFARILRGELPSEQVYEDDDTLVIMDIMPRAPGHMLVLPKGPARNLLDATSEQLCACISVAKRVAEAAKVAFNADGVTLQQFSEAAGGQEVFHLHFHVIPRMECKRMKPAGAGEMETPEVLQGHAERIRAVLEAA